MNGPGFATEAQLNLLSDFILPGDVQMTGDGVPYILGPECQTTGGYPRIGTVISADMPRAMQAVPGAKLRFRFVTLAEAREKAGQVRKAIKVEKRDVLAERKDEAAARITFREAAWPSRARPDPTDPRCRRWSAIRTRSRTC